MFCNNDVCGLIKPAQKERPPVLIVAGVDSGGGAGITADVLTVHDQGAWGLPVITALTCQSLDEVTLIRPTDKDIFEESIRLAATSWSAGIKAVKVGLITSQELLDSLLKQLDGVLKGTPVVWDPVLTATAGRLDSADLKKALPEILKRTSVFTPNLPEALELAGWTEDELKKKSVSALADVFLKAGAEAVLIKGGHGSELSAQDFFKSKTHAFAMRYSRRAGEGAHGGGCALSSALAGLIACGYAYEDAAVLAKVYVSRGIYEPEVEVTHKRPPLAHKGLCYDIKYMPEILEEGFPASAGPFPECPEHMGVYPVVSSVKMLERLLAVGVKTIQLRIKTDKPDDENNAELCEEIRRACFLGREFCARVFIDDHAKLAAKYGAFGVHLGMEDLRTADLKAVADAGLRLGVSTHGIYEVCKALTLNPSYIALGHIFPTKTKKMPSKPQGLEKLALQAGMLHGVVPVVAIGGIKLEHAQEILSCGVGSLAVVTAITDAAEPCLEARKWIGVCRTGPAEFYGKTPKSWQRRQDDQHKYMHAWEASKILPGLFYRK